jgi:hypothetical protein
MRGRGDVLKGYGGKRRPLARPRNMWKDDIKKDFK